MSSLNGEFDAREWAAEFKRLFPDSDEELIVGWFANAIVAGYDRGHADAAREAELWAHLGEHGCQHLGKPWDALAAQPEATP